MFESSYPPEAEANEVVSSGTIGQALDRIVSDAPRVPDLNKKLVFPRESVRVSELEEKQRKAREEEEKLARLAKEKKEKEEKVRLEAEKARLEAEKAAKAQQAKEFKDLDLPFEEEEVVAPKAAPAVERVAEAKKEVVAPQPSSPAPRKAEVSKPSAQPPKPAATAKKTAVKQVAVKPEVKAPEPKVEKEDVMPEREVVAYRRAIPARRRVVREVSAPERAEKEEDASVSEADLELYMRETEKVETRQVICRAATMQLIEEIAEQTGCAPEDLASQAVESVALAIQQAGYQFDLPMSVKCVREGK